MRFRAVQLVMYICFILIALRLAYWQVLASDELSAKGDDQRIAQKTILAPRGEIVFADGSELAATQPKFLLFAQPKIVKDKAEVAQKLSELLWQTNPENQKITDPLQIHEGMDKIRTEIDGNLQKNLFWVSLGYKVDNSVKKTVDAMKWEGVGFDTHLNRFYPEGSSSAHILGFVGEDAYGGDKGYFGLEGFYNGELRGKDGVLIQDQDALGLPILIGTYESTDPKPGKRLVLNIDRTIQHIVESSLKKGMQKYGAKGASVVVMEPKTGNVLAMVAYPSYDPNEPTKFSNDVFRNPIVADSYEPGSTFKVLIAAAGINEHLITPNTVCDICAGPVQIGEYSIKTWNNKYQANSSMTDVIVHSDNTGMVSIGRKLGVDRMYDYLNRFGMGNVTGIDLQDEQSPALRPKEDWKEIDVATASFGQGISVTPLQVVRAVGAIANGGKLMEPHVVNRIEDEGHRFEIKPKQVGEPISKETAEQVTTMMVQAVDSGEAKFVKPKGYTVAGKTGTAQIPVDGHYDANKTVASFVGFAPADDPRFVMLVRYDQPQSSIYGSETAAPTFFEIAKELFLYLGIAPDS